ncbi:mechanosensitive ion channel [candidate division WOR-3 bacterium]|nr:mechanosensitive ion channel [candidate division WOR-3 bacterium]
MEKLLYFFINPLPLKIELSIVFILLNQLIRGLVYKKIESRKVSRAKRYKSKKNYFYISNVVLFIILIILWLQNIRSVGTVVSILGAGIAVALQEVILALAGWFFIIIRHPFDIGDRIEIENIIGDVIDIRLFQFSVLEVKGDNFGKQSTARIINFPNSVVFKNPVFNSTKEFDYIWDEMAITLTYESNWKLAERELKRFIEKITEGNEENIRKQMKNSKNRYPIEYTYLSPKIYVSIVDSGILIVIRYMVRVREQRKYIDQISRFLLELVAKHKDIDLAYNTYRIVK